jgi:hypothetical protein
MAFHRLTVPSYFGGLPGSYDFINNTPGGGTQANADGPKVGGPNVGTYFVAFQEEATSLDFNRANQALAQNTDIIDDTLRTSIPVPDFVDATTAGAISEVVVAGDVFVGKSGASSTQDERNRLITVLNPITNSVLTSGGIRIIATGIEDGASANVVGTEADGFYSGPTVTFAPDIPATTDYRIIFGKRSNLASIADPAGDLAAFTREVIPVRIPPAEAIIYAGGPNWIDGVTNPATTVESQLDKIITDFSDFTATTSGADKIAGNTTAAQWADATTINGNPTTSVNALIEGVVTDLADSAGVGGAVKTGNIAMAGTSLSLVAGSLQSQLQAIIDGLGGLAATNTWTVANTFDEGTSINDTDPLTPVLSTPATAAGAPPSGDYKLIQRWTVSVGSGTPVSARLYMLDNGAGYGSVRWTINALWDSGGAQWRADDTSLSASQLSFDNDIFLWKKMFVTAVPWIAWDSNFSILPAGFGQDTTIQSDGVLVNDNATTCYASGEAPTNPDVVPASQVVGGTCFYGKRFSANPSSFVFTTLSIFNTPDSPSFTTSRPMGVHIRDTVTSSTPPSNGYARFIYSILVG